MKHIVQKRLSRLLCVKSIVTLSLTAVFAVLALTDRVSQDFMTIYSVIVAFYFGTQLHEKNPEVEVDGANGTS